MRGCGRQAQAIVTVELERECRVEGEALLIYPKR
jgi:hypothetical protein